LGDPPSPPPPSPGGGGLPTLKRSLVQGLLRLRIVLQQRPGARAQTEPQETVVKRLVGGGKSDSKITQNGDDKLHKHKKSVLVKVAPFFIFHAPRSRRMVHSQPWVAQGEEAPAGPLGLQPLEHRWLKRLLRWEEGTKLPGRNTSGMKWGHQWLLTYHHRFLSKHQKITRTCFSCYTYVDRCNRYLHPTNKFHTLSGNEKKTQKLLRSTNAVLPYPRYIPKWVLVFLWVGSHQNLRGLHNLQMRSHPLRQASGR